MATLTEKKLKGFDENEQPLATITVTQPIIAPKDERELLQYEAIYNLYRTDRWNIKDISKRYELPRDTILNAIAWVFDFHAQEQDCPLRKHYTVQNGLRE